MDLNTLSPYIRVARDDRIPAGGTIGERAIFDFELLYVKAGEIRVTIEDRTYRGLPGDLFLFKPLQRHSITVVGNEPLHQPHIHFDLYYRDDSPDVKVYFQPASAMTEAERQWIREDATRGMSPPLPNHFRLHKPQVVENLLFAIIREFDNRLLHYDITAKGLFVQLWIQLLREHHWMGNRRLLSKGEQLDRVKTYLSHRTDAAVTMEELADIANMSKFYLNRLFKHAYGITPIHYHALARLEKAKQLIQFTDEPLTRIAEQFGYQSIHAFSRAFRKAEGVPPSFYRTRK